MAPNAHLTRLPPSPQVLCILALQNDVYGGLNLGWVHLEFVCFGTAYSMGVYGCVDPNN